MRLTIKLTFILMLVIIIFMSVQAVRNTRRLTALHLQESRQGFMSLAGALSIVAEEIYKRSGRDEAESFLQKEQARRAGTRLRLFSGAPEKGPISAIKFADLPMEERGQFLAQRGDWLVMRMAVGTPAAPAVLEMQQSLADHDRYVSGVIKQQLVSTTVLSLLCGMVLCTLGISFIGRPVKLLLDQARNVANGDFSVRVMLRQRDEIGNLAREMNRMSERLEESREQVRRERRARTTALAQLRHADRLSTVGKLASGIAHELGTPLNVVSGRATMIAASQDYPEEIAADAHIIIEQAQHMTMIIRQLLDYARRRTLQRKVTDMGQLVDHARHLVEPLAEEHDVIIEMKEMPRVRTSLDADNALQVITNLMINGIQAMPGGGSLRLEVAVEQVSKPPSEYATAGPFVRIAVTDEGVGIAGEDIKHIFEPFFTTKGQGEGTGLGLSVCHGIVKEHGGWISVNSTPGSGSTFSVYFPLGESI